MTVATKRRKQPRHMQRIHQNGNGSQQPVAEIIGRAVYGLAQPNVYRNRLNLLSVDNTVPDYAFYDLLRRGKQPGYRLGALFAKRIERIFANWILGRGVTVRLAESGDPDNENDTRNVTDGILDDFIQANHALLMTVKEDSLGLGDQYIVVNADSTLSVPSPDTVEVIRDDFDYRKILAIRITTKLEKVTIIDEYRADGRTVTYRYMVDGRIVERDERYANLIGRIQVIHIAHGMSGNETNGHSIHEDLLMLYSQYDDVIDKQLHGAKLLGNPIIAFTGLEDLTAVIDANKPVTAETYIDQGGIEITRPQLNIDRNSVLLIGKGGDAKFVAPPVGFSADTQQSLKTLFLLLLDRTGIAEFIWGNEMSSARASSDTQMMQWSHDIEGMQKGDERWLLELCGIWLLTSALTDPALVVDKLTAEWAPVLDANQELRLKTLMYASTENLLTAKTKLELTELPVDDIDAEIAGGEAEAQARAADEQARMEAQVAAAAKARPVGEMNGSNGYNELEATGIVAGAIRQLAGGV